MKPEDVRQDPRLSSDKTAVVDGAGSIGLKLVANMEQITLDRIAADGIENIKRNLKHLDKGKSLAALRNDPSFKGDSAVIILAGPSLKRRNVANRVNASGFKGTVITSDSSLWYCLRHGIIPDLVVTLDPHATRIVRWFGDPDLTEATLRKDDYFSRQDMDTAFANELNANKEILRLLAEHGPKIKIAIATCASEKVVNRVLNTGMQIYWWNPMYDDPDKEGGMTQQVFDMNGLPCLNAGGNVGGACWMIADAVLGKKHVAVTGMDFSYYGDTSYKNTQYYYEAIDLVGEENLDSIYIRIFNPYLNKWFFTDPAYYWYRQSFLEMAAEGDCVTYNCTEGGILFGDAVRFISLEDFLDPARRNTTEYRHLEIEKEK